MTDVIPIDDGLTRCWWAADERPDPLMRAYHDDEWGRPVRGDAELFERLSLEAFQAGLSWRTILVKREAFRRAFRGFEPAVVAAFGDDDRERLLGDASIVRNRAKIDATIANAVATLRLAGEHGSFAAYLDRLVPPPPRRLGPDAAPGDVPATTPASDRVSRELAGQGFRFV
ncbi:MAG TPA: DNA-3-methyladenine glycosylase I, partial [Candidatus Limnocylindrales bacterium]|nr:DNA-3-methyladenine glycosylase I [Candidatus Limnocylindrales bacterium]